MNPFFEQQLAEIDTEMDKLMARRNQVIMKAALAEELESMRRKGKMISDIMVKAAMYNRESAAMAVLYINAYILPWKKYISSAHFPNTLELLPNENLRSDCNPTELSTFLIKVSRALERDRAVLREISFE